MLNRATIAAEIVEEVETFVLAHPMNETEFIDALGTNDALLRRLRRPGGNTSIAMLGRIRDCMKAIDGAWVLKDDRRDQVLAAVGRFRAEPTLDNQKRLFRAEDCLAAWPVVPAVPQ